MAILHQATLTPTKPEAARAWLDLQPWGGSGPVEVIGSYRFDDPAGEVGVEALLVRRGDRVLQVALTYRGAPLPGGRLVTTMQHSVLGDRWVYEASSDPVAVGCFTRALAGEQEAADFEVLGPDGTVTRREPTVRVRREPGAASEPVDVLVLGELHPRAAGAATSHPEASSRLVATWADGEAVVAFR